MGSGSGTGWGVGGGQTFGCSLAKPDWRQDILPLTACTVYYEKQLEPSASTCALQCAQVMNNLCP